MSKKKEQAQANLRFQKNHFPVVLPFLLWTLDPFLCLFSYACPVLFESLKWLGKTPPAQLVSSHTDFFPPCLFIPLG